MAGEARPHYVSLCGTGNILRTAINGSHFNLKESTTEISAISLALTAAVGVGLVFSFVSGEIFWLIFQSSSSPRE